MSKSKPSLGPSHPVTFSQRQASPASRQPLHVPDHQLVGWPPEFPQLARCSQFWGHLGQDMLDRFLTHLSELPETPKEEPPPPRPQETDHCPAINKIAFKVTDCAYHTPDTKYLGVALAFFHTNNRLKPPAPPDLTPAVCHQPCNILNCDYQVMDLSSCIIVYRHAHLPLQPGTPSPADWETFPFSPGHLHNAAPQSAPSPRCPQGQLANFLAISDPG